MAAAGGAGVSRQPLQQKRRRRLSRAERPPPGPALLIALPNDLIKSIAQVLPIEDIARFGTASSATRQAVTSLPASFYRQELYKTLSDEFEHDLFGVGYDPSVGVEYKPGEEKDEPEPERRGPFRSANNSTFDRKLLSVTKTVERVLTSIFLQDPRYTAKEEQVGVFNLWFTSALPYPPEGNLVQLKTQITTPSLAEWRAIESYGADLSGSYSLKTQFYGHVDVGTGSVAHADIRVGPIVPHWWRKMVQVVADLPVHQRAPRGKVGYAEEDDPAFIDDDYYDYLQIVANLVYVYTSFFPRARIVLTKSLEKPIEWQF